MRPVNLSKYRAVHGDEKANSIEKASLQKRGDYVWVEQEDWERITPRGAAATKRIARAVKTAAHAGKSVAKTKLIRKDRVTDEQFEMRLDVCRQCPDDYAVWRNGDVHTCGKMIQSLVQANSPTCGCILREKARDRKEQCPLGHWPSIENAPPEQEQDK